MSAFRLNLKILQGSDFSQVCTWKAGTPPAPVDLTGCTARMQVRARVAAPEVLLDLTTQNGGIALGGALGTIEIRLSAAQTAAIGWTVAFYDLEIVYLGGAVQRKIEGQIAVSPEVTRA